MKPQNKPTKTGVKGEVVINIKEFYEKDSISRMMAGKADYITVKANDGSANCRK